jgi:hypothetical protein
MAFSAAADTATKVIINLYHRSRRLPRKPRPKVRDLFHIRDLKYWKFGPKVLCRAWGPWPLCSVALGKYRGITLKWAAETSIYIRSSLTEFRQFCSGEGGLQVQSHGHDAIGRNFSRISMLNVTNYLIRCNNISFGNFAFAFIIPHVRKLQLPWRYQQLVILRWSSEHIPHTMYVYCSVVIPSLRK